MAFAIAVAVEAAKTHQDGRQLLGVATDYLGRAYALVPELTTWGGVRDNARELLDRVNAYAGGIYAMLHDDGTLLSEQLRKSIGVALNQASEDMLLVESVDANLQWSFLQALADVIPAGIAAIAGAVGSVAFDHWFLTIAIAVVALVLLPFLLRRFGAIARVAA
jgi:hypothetical protein